MSGACRAAQREFDVVALAQPGDEAARVLRLRTRHADALRHHAHSVLVGIQPPHGFAEYLADAVARIRAHRLVRALPAARGDKSPRHGGSSRRRSAARRLARGLEHVVGADDVGLQNRLPGRLDRHAAQVDDASTPSIAAATCAGRPDRRAWRTRRAGGQRQRRGVAQPQRLAPGLAAPAEARRPGSLRRRSENALYGRDGLVMSLC